MISSAKTVRKIFDDLLMYPASKVYDWETTLVVAPQPEDESLGCGGAIALLREKGYRVHILYFTHGYMENISKPAQTGTMLKKMKEEEAKAALETLKVTEESATFLHIRNQLVPKKGEPGFEEAVRLSLNELESYLPATVLLPCRFHPYEDHFATWQIMMEAIGKMPYQIRTLEYMIWKGEQEHQEIVTHEAVKPWRLDIKHVMQQKINAIAQHHSQEQTPPLRNPSSLAKQQKEYEKTQPWETYLEAVSF